MAKAKLFEVYNLRGVTKGCDESAVEDLVKKGYGLFVELDDHTPCLVDLGLSESTEHRAKYVQLIDEFAPDIARLAAGILQTGMTPIEIIPRFLGLKKVSTYNVVSGLETVFAQLYNHCKTGIPARVLATVVAS